MTDQASLLRERMSGAQILMGNGRAVQMAKMIAVGSGKGGVGKSNFCVNFALALSQKGVRVLVIDTDVGFANVEVLVNVNPSHSLLDVLKGRRLADLVEHAPSGLSFISGGNGLFSLSNVNEQDFDLLLRELHQVCSMYDIVLLDCAAGFTEVSRQVVGASDELIMVTTPEPTAMTDAYAFMKLLIQHNALPSTKILINRASTFTHAKQAADTLMNVATKFLLTDLGVLGYILEDATVGEAVMRQIPVLNYAFGSRVSSCYLQVASNFVRQDVRTPKAGITGFFDRLLRMRRLSGKSDNGHSA